MRMKINCNNINPHFSEIINPADRRERTTDAAMHTKAHKTDIVISFEKPFQRRFIHREREMRVHFTLQWQPK